MAEAPAGASAASTGPQGHVGEGEMVSTEASDSSPILHVFKQKPSPIVFVCPTQEALGAYIITQFASSLISSSIS